MSDDELDFMPAKPDADEPASGESKSGDGGDSDRAPGERAELPTWNRSRRKRKANVKAEKEDDVFQRGVRKASRQVIDTPKLVIGALIIGVAVIAGGVALNNRNVEADAEAARVLQTATDAIVRGQVVPAEELERLGDQVKLYRLPIFTTQDERDATIEEALGAAQSTGRKKVDQDAQLVAAARSLRQGDFDAAISGYDAFLDAIAKDHPLRFLALEGKGNALEGKGELDAALAVYQEIAPHPSDHYRPMAMYHQGRVLEGLERTDEALELYRQYFEEFKSEELATPMIRERVEALDPNFAASLATPPPTPLGIP